MSDRAPGLPAVWVTAPYGARYRSGGATVLWRNGDEFRLRFHRRVEGYSVFAWVPAEFIQLPKDYAEVLPAGADKKRVTRKGQHMQGLVSTTAISICADIARQEEIMGLAVSFALTGQTDVTTEQLAAVRSDLTALGKDIEDINTSTSEGVRERVLLFADYNAGLARLAQYEATLVTHVAKWK